MGCLGFYGLVGEVVSSAVREAAREGNTDPALVYAKLRAKAEVISEIYRTGGVPSHVDALDRFAYMVQYTAAHADSVYQIMRRTDIFQSRPGPNTNLGASRAVCILGGGPGSELLALLKDAEVRGKKDRLRVTSLDLDPEWRTCHTPIVAAVRRRLIARYGAVEDVWPFTFDARFLTLDLVNSPACCGGENCASSLYILNYVVSEVGIGTPEGLRPFFERSVVRCAPSGSQILMIDRNESKWLEEGKKLATMAGFAVFASDSETLQMSVDEEKTDMGEVWGGLNGWRPLMGRQVCWLAGTKE